MENLNRYIKHDLNQLFYKKRNMYFYLFLLALFLFDTFYTVYIQSAFDIEDSVYWYVFLENSFSLIRGLYFIIIPLLASFPFASQYFYEKKSNFRNYLIVRGNRKAYYTSKLLVSFGSGFFIIFSVLIINYVICYFVYPHNLVIGGTFVEPDDGAFLQNVFHHSPSLYQLMYIVINSIAGGIFSLFAFSLSLILNYKSEFLVLGVPFILFSIQAVVLYFVFPQVDILTIIQPATRFAFVSPITFEHILSCLILWSLLIIFAFSIGYKKERDLT